MQVNIGEVKTEIIANKQYISKVIDSQCIQKLIHIFWLKLLDFRNPSMFIDFESLPKVVEREVYDVQNDTSLQHSSDYDEYSMLNVNITSIIDRLDQDVLDDTLLPNKFECGDAMQFVNRVFGGDFTSISEFPWYGFTFR